MTDDRADSFEDRPGESISRRAAVGRTAGLAAGLLAAGLGARAIAAQEATPAPDGSARYVAIRSYRLAAGMTYEDLYPPIEREYFPLISALPGFVAHYIVDAGEGNVVAVSVWTSKEAADESNRRAADFVAQSLVGFFEGPPEVTEGQAGLYHEATAGVATPTA